MFTRLSVPTILTFYHFGSILFLSLVADLFFSPYLYKVISASGKVVIVNPLVGGPLILLVDDNRGRIEYFEHVFYHNGYQTRAVTLDKLEQGISQGDVRLVLTYIPFDPKKVTALDIPVISAVPDEYLIEEFSEPSNPLVSCMPISASLEALIEKISSLIKS